MKYIILTHASPEIGFGHINRCHVLAESIRQTGDEALLIVNDHPSARAFIDDPHVCYLQNWNPSEWPDADNCIVDLYRYDSSFYSTLHNKYPYLIIFDDFLFKAPPHVSAVINGNIYAREEMYTSQVQVFAGVKYFLMRPELFRQKRSDRSQNVLVCMGGSDPESQTNRILQILSKLTTRHIDVVFGPGFEDLSVIEKWSVHKNITTHYAVSRMNSLMKNAAYCVASAGSMMYELAHMGVPTACLSLIDHQRLIADEFSRKNATLYLGHFQEIHDSDIISWLQILDNDEQMRSSLGRVSQTLVDGMGPQRLVGDLRVWLKGGEF